jgi:hypothetical protein
MAAGARSPPRLLATCYLILIDPGLCVKSRRDLPPHEAIDPVAERTIIERGHAVYDHLEGFTPCTGVARRGAHAGAGARFSDNGFPKRLQ